jgi:hypothetical protein
MHQRTSARSRCLLDLAAVVLAVLVVLPTVASAQESEPAVSVRTVRFHVQNVNRSLMPCPADGAGYDIVGRLVGPAGPPSSAVTVYVHGLGFGAFFWNLAERPAYDFAARLAAKGETSLVIDRLGYGSSGHPAGMQTCLGAQADVVHQVIGQLRAGAYQPSGTRATRFRRGRTLRRRPGRPARGCVVP